jgi:hypothetical protein
VGRIGRSWDLVSRSFAILRSDMQLLLLPIASACFHLSVSAVIVAAGTLFFGQDVLTFFATRPPRMALSQGMWACLLVFYLANYCIAIFFNVALVTVASDRLNGGHATLSDGIQIAWQRKGSIFQWALLSATVGVLLRAIEDRMGWIGRMIIGWLGVAWSLATYFVVPLLAAENMGPVEALQRSADIFKETWGEELVGGFSFGLIFFLLAIPGIALFVVGIRFGITGLIFGAALAILYFLLLAAVSAAVQGVFMAALYRYATSKQVPPGFTQADFAGAWRPKS